MPARKRRKALQGTPKDATPSSVTCFYRLSLPFVRRQRDKVAVALVQSAVQWSSSGQTVQRLRELEQGNGGFVPKLTALVKEIEEKHASALVVDDEQLIGDENDSVLFSAWYDFALPVLAGGLRFGGIRCQSVEMIRRDLDVFSERAQALQQWLSDREDQHTAEQLQPLRDVMAEIMPEILQEEKRRNAFLEKQAKRFASKQSPKVFAKALETAVLQYGANVARQVRDMCAASFAQGIESRSTSSVSTSKSTSAEAMDSGTTSEVVELEETKDMAPRGRGRAVNATNNDSDDEDNSIDMLLLEDESDLKEELPGKTSHVPKPDPLTVAWSRYFNETNDAFCENSTLSQSLSRELAEPDRGVAQRTRDRLLQDILQLEGPQHRELRNVFSFSFSLRVYESYLDAKSISIVWLNRCPHCRFKRRIY